jgi:hypothetical protein
MAVGIVVALLAKPAAVTCVVFRVYVRTRM